MPIFQESYNITVSLFNTTYLSFSLIHSSCQSLIQDVVQEYLPDLFNESNLESIQDKRNVDSLGSTSQDHLDCLGSTSQEQNSFVGLKVNYMSQEIDKFVNQQTD